MKSICAERQEIKCPIFHEPPELCFIGCVLSHVNA